MYNKRLVMFSVVDFKDQDTDNQNDVYIIMHIYTQWFLRTRSLSNLTVAISRGTSFTRTRFIDAIKAAILRFVYIETSFTFSQFMLYCKPFRYTYHNLCVSFSACLESCSACFEYFL